jgi:hypothetical protein
MPLFSADDFVGPFGKNITGKTISNSADTCSGRKLLSKAVVESGLNFIDQNSQLLFGCDLLQRKQIYSNGGMLEKACLTQKDKINCYSSGSNYIVCINNPREVLLNTEHGSPETLKEYGARFDGLYLFSKDESGFQKEKSWNMDLDGCHPVVANIYNPVIPEDACRNLMTALAEGGRILPSSISDEKFCGGKITSNLLNALVQLNTCIESYPRLRDIDREKLKSISPNKTNLESTSIIKSM